MRWFTTSCQVSFTGLDTAPVQHAITGWIATAVLLAFTAVDAIGVSAVMAGLVVVTALPTTTLSLIAPVSALDPQEEP